MDWLRDTFRTDPHWATFWCGVALMVLLAAFKFVRDRHKETMAFRSHVRREESEVWPRMEAGFTKITQQHEDLLEKLNEHSVQIAVIKDKMPNGDVAIIKSMLAQVLGGRRVE